MAVPKKKKSTSFTKIHRFSWLNVLKKKRNNYLLIDKNFYTSPLSKSLLKKISYTSFLQKI